MEFKPECRRCHVEMKPGFLVNVPEGELKEFSPLPITILLDWKCPECGRRFVPRSTNIPTLTTP